MSSRANETEVQWVAFTRCQLAIQHHLFLCFCVEHTSQYLVDLTILVVAVEASSQQTVRHPGGFGWTMQEALVRLYSSVPLVSEKCDTMPAGCSRVPTGI